MFRIDIKTFTAREESQPNRKAHCR